MHVTVLEAGSAPDDSARREIRALAAAIEREDGAPPLSDQALAQLATGTVGHVLAGEGDAVVGYLQTDGGAGELVAAPDAVGPLLDAVPVERIWSHGQRSRLVGPLTARGFTRERELRQLRRPSQSTLPADPALPDGIVVRPFVPGEDDTAWLALNAAAFEHHPEQGRQTQADLDARMAEDWFDPAGFLLAQRTQGSLAAFHWTKVHPDGLGEVYVLGVAPDAQGLGLGGALLTRGLRYLIEVRGCPAILLYVEADNIPALHLYERDGFAPFDVDVQWARGESSP